MRRKCNYWRLLTKPQRWVTHQCLKLVWRGHEIGNIRLNFREKRAKLKEAEIAVQDLYWRKCKVREETLQQQAELAGGKGDKKDKIIRTILKSERERRDHATLKRSMKSVRAGADPEVEVPKTTE